MEPSAVLLQSLRVGLPRKIAAPTPWYSAFMKDPVNGPVRLAHGNLAGDRQGDLRVHGGPDKAVCVYPASNYVLWRQELGIPHCGPGWFGENFTVEGQAEKTACVGDVYRVGTALVQIAQPRGPCFKLAHRWGLPDMVQLVNGSRRSGWYLRVLEEGEVEAGQPLTLVERPFPRWTIDRVNDLTHATRDPANRLDAERRELAACPSLAKKWQRQISKAG